MTTVPTPLIRWFKSTYPTLQFSPDWIEACVQYLREHFPATTAQQLVKLVETQLLLSDLSSSTLPSPSLLPLPSTAPDVKGKRRKLFEGKGKSVLFQITSVEEIAQPALSLLRILKERQELARMKALDQGIDEIERERRRIREEGMEGEGEGREGEWVRGLIKLELSDGFHSVNAIEWQQIQGFGIEELKLGAKILVHDVRIVKGVLLLSPASVTIKGLSVEEFEVSAEFKFENRLRTRLKMPLLDDAAAALPPPAPPPPNRQKRAQPQNQLVAAPAPASAGRPSETDSLDADIAAAEAGAQQGNVDEWGMDFDFEMDEEAEKEARLAERKEAARARLLAAQKKKQQSMQGQQQQPKTIALPTSSSTKPIILEIDSSPEPESGVAPPSARLRQTQTQQGRMQGISGSGTAAGKRRPIEVIEIDDSSDEG